MVSVGAVCVGVCGGGGLWGGVAYGGAGEGERKGVGGGGEEEGYGILAEMRCSKCEEEKRVMPLWELRQ